MCTVHLFCAKSWVKFQPNMWQTLFFCQSEAAAAAPWNLQKIQKIVNVLDGFSTIKGVHQKTQDQYLASASTTQLGISNMYGWWWRNPELAPLIATSVWPVPLAATNPYHVLNWFFHPKLDFLEIFGNFWNFFGIFSSRNHLKSQLSLIFWIQILPNKFPLNPAHQDLSNNTKGTFQFLTNFLATI
jgi:hypothetical protein